jgi:predicted MPP superfamily phosphohydrolase
MRASTAAICLTPAAAVSFGILRRKNFKVNELSLKFPNLPRDLRNVRIVQISDTHLGAFYSERDLEHVVDAANELRGDLAIMTGDLITSKGDPLDACLRQLSRLKNTSGIWACMGNHEHFAGVEDVAAIRGARLGVNFLRFQNRTLKFGDSSLNLVGVDYQSPRWKPYLVNAEELVETGQFNVLLSHNPDVFPVAAEKGYDLVLSGHTHGGQVNVEIFEQNLNIASFVTPYTKGLYQDAASAIYVNSGIGTIGMPIRLGAPPEITLITLCDS